MPPLTKTGRCRSGLEKYRYLRRTQETSLLRGIPTEIDKTPGRVIFASKINSCQIVTPPIGGREPSSVVRYRTTLHRGIDLPNLAWQRGGRPPHHREVRLSLDISWCWSEAWERSIIVMVLCGSRRRRIRYFTAAAWAGGGFSLRC